MSIKAEFEKTECNKCTNYNQSKATDCFIYGDCYIKHLETLIKKDYIKLKDLKPYRFTEKELRDFLKNYIKRSESVQIIDDKLKELRKAFNMLNVKDLIRNMFEHHLDDIKQNLISEVKP